MLTYLILEGWIRCWSQSHRTKLVLSDTHCWTGQRRCIFKACRMLLCTTGIVGIESQIHISPAQCLTHPHMYMTLRDVMLLFISDTHKISIEPRYNMHYLELKYEINIWKRGIPLFYSFSNVKFNLLFKWSCNILRSIHKRTIKFYVHSYKIRIIVLTNKYCDAKC